METMFEEFESFDSSPPWPVAETSPLVRLQYLIDNTPVIVYSAVPTGDFKLTFVSKNATRVLGYLPEDMLADPNFWFDHIHPEDAATSVRASAWNRSRKALIARLRL